MNRYLVLCANIRVLSAQIKELCAKGFMCHVSHVRCWVQKLECPVQPKGGKNGSIPLVELMVFKTLGSVLYPSWWQHAAIHEQKIFGSRKKRLTLFLLFLFLRHRLDFSWFSWFQSFLFVLNCSTPFLTGLPDPPWERGVTYCFSYLFQYTHSLSYMILGLGFKPFIDLTSELFRVVSSCSVTILNSSLVCTYIHCVTSNS